MKKHILLFSTLALLAVAIVSSCKKDPDPNNNSQNNDGIHFGDTAGMIVTAYDSIMRFDESWQPFILDLDGNGTDDIKIGTFYDGPLAIGEYQTLTLYCLNSKIEILGDSVVKESYSHRDTIITTHDGWTTTSHEYTFSTCDKIAENDPISHTTVFEIAASDYDDLFGTDDHFQSIEVRLFREDYSFEWLNDYNEDEQYVIRSENRYIYDCWNFPTDEEKYIGFKLTQNGISRLGWLKIKLHPTWGNSVVDTELIETAIQR